MSLSFSKSYCLLLQDCTPRNSYVKESREYVHCRKSVYCHLEASSLPSNMRPCYSQSSLKEGFSFGSRTCGVISTNFVNSNCFVSERVSERHNLLTRSKKNTFCCCTAAGDEAERSFINTRSTDQAKTVQIDIRPESKKETHYTATNASPEEVEVVDSFSKPDSSCDKLNSNSSFQITDKSRNATSVLVNGVEELLKKNDFETSVKIQECDRLSSNSQNVRKEVVRRKRKLQNGNEKKTEEGVLNLDGVRVVEKGVSLNAFWCFGSWLYKKWLVQETCGTELLPLHRGVFLLASNHSSHLDCGALFVAAWAGGVKNVYALGARDYFFSHPLKAWFVSNFMHVIPFNRRGFSQWEVDIIQQIKDNSSPESPSAIVIFPEGTRTKDGSLQRFKSGVSFLSEKLDVPVVPACVKGTLNALPKGRTIPHRHKVKVEFGKPLEMRTYLEKMNLSDNDDESTSTTEISRVRQAEDSLGNSSSIERESVITVTNPVRFVQSSSSKISAMSSISPSEEGQQLSGSSVTSFVREGESNTREQRSPLPNVDTEGGNKNTRAQRRLAQQKFTDDLRNSVPVMLGN